MSQDEGTVPEAQLIQVIAMDDDTVPQNADVTYSITSGNTSIFTIDNVVLSIPAVLQCLPYTFVFTEWKLVLDGRAGL